MLGNSFYYGEFEYPKGSGKKYKGNHKPMITKKLFLEVREQLKVPIKTKWGSKEFPFKQFLKCHSCGSSIVGEEKFRKLTNGKTRRHVYYRCSRQVDLTCKEPAVLEETIINELSLMCNELITNLTEVEPGLRDAINKFTKMMRITNETYSPQDMVGGYIKYVLHEGTLFEKTRLVRNLNIKLVLHDQKLIKA